MDRLRRTLAAATAAALATLNLTTVTDVRGLYRIPREGR